MPDTAPFILVDGSSYLFRAFHALPPLSNSRGEPTGAVVGVVNMLRRLLDQYGPGHIAVVFDAPGRTFREDIYEAYKANRPPMPDELRAQVEPLHEIVRAMGLPLVMVEGVEADDVIATLAERATAQGMDTLISTGDKDLTQLVDDHVTLVNTMTDTVLDREAVIAKFGVPPERMVDLLALIGDPIDNVPGVPKCGPKTAAKWLTQYGSLDGIIEHADEIKGKVGDNLRASLDQLALSRKLVTVDRHLDLEQGPEDLVLGEPDAETLRAWYTRIEARRLLATLDAGESGTSGGGGRAGTAPRYEAVLDEAAFDAWLRRLEGAELIAVDTETTDLSYMRAELVGVSFCVEPGEAAYVPVDHRYPGAPQQLDREWVLTRLKGFLEDPERAKVGQNLKYDMGVLARYGVALRGVRFDTMLESYVIDSTATRHDMDSLAGKYLGWGTIKYEDVAGKGAKQLSFDQVPLEQAVPYAAEDAEVTLRLHQALWPKIDSEPSLRGLFQEIEMPLVPVISRMERRGVRVDRAMLATQSRELAEGMAAVEDRAYAIAERPFNLGSPKQIGQIFFEELGLPVM
ncbi:MAG: 5'-3' exonuclease H3TH domain-containing protein, partial [Chromatiales bacterium]